MDDPRGINFQPMEYVDITDVFPVKYEMMEKHASQLVSMKEHSNADIST